MGRRIALLIGNQDFLPESGLKALRGPVNDVEALKHVLKNPALGNFDVLEFINKPHFEVNRGIVETLQSAKKDDFVLIYYSGHGTTSISGKLFLATADTDQGALQATAVSAWSLHEAVNDSPCEEIVLLLDCCYSGAVSQGLRGTVDGQLRSVQNAAGFFILTASTDIQTASENEGDSNGKIMGRFTAAVVEGIQSGSADDRQTGEIRLTDLKAHVERSIKGQTTQLFVHAGSGDPLISFSAQSLLDQGVMADLKSEAWHRRRGVVAYLADILQMGRPRQSQAAQRLLADRQAWEADERIRKAIDDALRVQDLSSAFATRDKMLRGVNNLANAVKVTLGPKGRTVVIGMSDGTPRSTKIGVSVAKEIELSDPFENLGVRLIREAAFKTDAKAGDGTTTAIVLARAILVEGLKLVADGANPTDLKHGLDQALSRVVEKIKSTSRAITSSAEVGQIGAISTNGDSDVGKMIAMAADKVGNDGVIIVEETENSETEIHVAKGLRFDRGYLSPYFITNVEKSIVEFDDPYILIHEKKLSALQPLLPILEAVVQSGRPLLIIAQDVEGEPLATLNVNKLRGGLKVAAVKSPGFGDRRRAILEDVAILTGGQVISDDLGIKLETVTLSMLGRARKVIIAKHEATIICRSDEAVAYPSVRQINPRVEETASDYDREKPQEHLVKFGGRAAIIRIGGSSEVEVKEKRDRVDDALIAIRAAVMEGIVPGAGVALLKASEVLDGFKCENDDQDAGVAILRRALEAPVRQISENAGVDGSIVVGRILENPSPTFGFNAQTKQFVDLIEAGIIDPAKVVRTALQEAVSAAGSFINTEGAILEVERHGGLPDGGFSGK